MADRLRTLDQRASHPKATRAQDYLLLAHDSASQALEAMQELRRERRRASGKELRGRTSDQDQDLLRAMLVFACAGVDAATKTLIEDALPALAEHHSGVQEKLSTFTERFVSEAGAVSPRAISQLLSDTAGPRDALIKAYVNDLTGGSLQSADELDKVCGALGIEKKEIRKEVGQLRDVFRARNEIIHELDLLSTPGGRARRDRAIGEMVGWASDALFVTQSIVNEVSDLLDAAG